MDPWLFIVLLGAGVMVYALLLPKTPSISKQSSIIREIEETIEHFVVDIEEENKELLTLVADMKKDGETQTSKLLGRIELIEKKLYEISSGIDHKAIILHQEAGLVSNTKTPVNTPMDELPAPIADNAAIIDKTEKIEEAVDISHMNIKKRYLELLDLDRQGKSIEYIAKKLSMNKGEIQLILQLAKQEEQFRV